MSIDSGQPDVPEEDDDVVRRKHDHDEELAEEWEDESFPASDPPSNY